MKYGLALPYGQTRNIARWAKLAEEHGWDGLFLGDAIWCEDPMIALAVAATTTDRIRLGTFIVPVPLRKPWKIASEALALDQLSDGRTILGLATGAVWMGWQSFPDEVTDTKARREMLDETVDILTLLFQSKPFDYAGNHYHVKLTLLDEMHYPAKPVQRPRIPLWAPAVWPSKKSIQRALKCDGVILERAGSEGGTAAVTPEDVRQAGEYIASNRSGETPFDIVIEGKSFDLEPAGRLEKMTRLKEAGATWWIEGLWGESEEAVVDYIRQGPSI